MQCLENIDIFERSQLHEIFSCFTFNIEFFQGLWFNRDSSLWMLPCMNNDLVSQLSKRGISNVQQLLDLPKAKLQMLPQNYPTQLYEVYPSQFSLQAIMHRNILHEWINLCTFFIGYIDRYIDNIDNTLIEACRTWFCIDCGAHSGDERSRLEQLRYGVLNQSNVSSFLIWGPQV